MGAKPGGAVMLLAKGIDCVESAAPGARCFVWRGVDGRLHALRFARGTKGTVTTSVRPVQPDRIDVLLDAIGVRRPAASLKWTPAEASVPKQIIANMKVLPNPEQQRRMRWAAKGARQ